MRRNGLAIRRRSTAAFVAYCLTASLVVAESDAKQRTVADARLGPLVNLRTSEFPFDPPSSIESWNDRADRVRRQIRVATGQWPPPRRPTPAAVLHGVIERDDYTVAKVYLESISGHFVTGSLFRPKHYSGKRPAVLSPYGHWSDGRYQDWGLKEVRRQIVTGGERFEVGGRHIIQARAVQLARMGCIVFVYDMLGYADSQQVSERTIHRPDAMSIVDGADGWGFYSTRAELRLQSPLGVQTYNGLCALDWLLSLEEVDSDRVAVVGGSGGATQTLMIGAVDERPAVFFPAVMVSTAMQGGCGCENACNLRIDTGNVEFAGVLAPKPLGMTAADDWTREFSTKGYPQLTQLYQLLGVPERVSLAALVEYPHNFNHPSRMAMYECLNRWLSLGHSTPIVERDYLPLTREELCVWDAEHPAPSGGMDHEKQLLARMAADSDAQIRSLWPSDKPTMANYRHVVGGAWKVLLAIRSFGPKHIRLDGFAPAAKGTRSRQRMTIANSATGAHLPALAMTPANDPERWVVWIDAQGIGGIDGDESPQRAAIERLLSSGTAILTADLLYQGELQPEDSPIEQTRVVEGTRPIAPLTYGYNRTVVAHRASDVLTLLLAARLMAAEGAPVLLLAGPGTASYAAGAMAIASGHVDAAAICSNGFRFSQVRSWRHPDFLPGAIKYGDLPGMLAVAAPTPLWLGEASLPEIIQRSYDSSGAAARVQSAGIDATLKAAIENLLRPE